VISVSRTGHYQARGWRKLGRAHWDRVQVHIGYYPTKQEAEQAVTEFYDRQDPTNYNQTYRKRGKQ